MNKATYMDVLAVPTKERATITHKEMIKFVREQLWAHKHAIANETYRLSDSGFNMDGVITMQHNDTGHPKHPNPLAVYFRNSYSNKISTMVAVGVENNKGFKHRKKIQHLSFDHAGVCAPLINDKSWCSFKMNAGVLISRARGIHWRLANGFKEKRDTFLTEDMGYALIGVATGKDMLLPMQSKRLFRGWSLLARTGTWPEAEMTIHTLHSMFGEEASSAPLRKRVEKQIEVHEFFRRESWAKTINQGGEYDNQELERNPAGFGGANGGHVRCADGAGAIEPV